MRNVFAGLCHQCLKVSRLPFQCLPHILRILSSEDAQLQRAQLEDTHLESCLQKCLTKLRRKARMLARSCAYGRLRRKLVLCVSLRCHLLLHAQINAQPSTKHLDLQRNRCRCQCRALFRMDMRASVIILKDSDISKPALETHKPAQTLLSLDAKGKGLALHQRRFLEGLPPCSRLKSAL